MPQKPEYLTIKPLQEGTCEVHDWPTKGMPQRLVEAMRASHPKGINACRECVERATAESDRERRAKCVLCHRGVGRGAGGRGHGFAHRLGRLDTACPVSQEQLAHLEAELEKAVADMFDTEGAPE